MQKKWVVYFGVVTAFFALAGLTVAVFWQHRTLAELQLQQELVERKNVTAPIAAPATAANLTGISQASSSALVNIQQQLNELTERIAKLEKKAGVPTTKKPTSDVKEYTIYLGTGQTNQRDWTDIPAALGELNTGNYTNIKSVYFESALSILGGEAHARLKNQTTGQVLYDTEVWSNTSSPVWKTSTAFQATSGTNSYVVQLKSTSGELAILSGARLHLFLQ